MTVSSSTAKAGPYAGAGLPGPFTVPFRFLSASHLQVIKTSAAGIDTELVLTTDYTVAGVGAASGSVTLTAPLASGERLTIVRDVPFTQLADYVNNDAFPAESHEDALDLLTMQTQQLKERVDSALTLPPTVTGASGELPSPEPNKLIGWDEAGNALQNMDATTLATIVAFGTSRADTFTGNGTQTQFALTANPGALANLDVAIGGVTQTPGVDYTFSGTTLTFISGAPALGAVILARFFQALPQGVTDSAASTFVQAGAGAVTRTVQEKLRDVVNVKDFGAVGDGVADDTAAIQAAITFAAQQFSADWFSVAQYNNVRVVELAPLHRIADKLLIPRGIVVRGKNTTLIGNGNGVGSNICFETAYFNAGVITSNIGTPIESQRVQFSSIENVRFVSFRIAINVYNFNEGCAVQGCSFFNCGQAVVADRSWYSRWTNLSSRELTALAASTDACYDFRNFANQIEIDSIMCTNRILGMRFSGGVNGLQLRNVSIESGTNGIRFEGNVNPMSIESCYFEALTGIGLDFTAGGGTQAITIDNNWFQNINTCISGANMTGGRIGRGNFFDTSITNRVVISDVVSTIKVELPFSRIASNAGTLRPSIPAGYTLGAGVMVEYPVQVFDSATGATIAQQMYTNGPSLIPYSGKQGTITNRIPFCDHVKTAGTTFDVTIDTRIEFDAYVMYTFAFVVTDNISSYRFEGRGFGTSVRRDDANGKTLTASNSGGFLRLTVGSFSHPSQIYSCEGVVRIT